MAIPGTSAATQASEVAVLALRRSVEKRLMKQLAILSALIAVVAFLPGCFVMDELDSGMALMKEHSPKEGKKSAAEDTSAVASASQNSKKPDARVALAKWWKSARTPTSGPKEGQPATEIVSCRIGGGVRFMARTDCEVQGGSF